ncbi:MFS transporter [Kitasatospora sp. NPDC054939]
MPADLMAADLAPADFIPADLAPGRTGSAVRAGFAVLGAVQAVLIFTIMILSVPLPLVAREFGLGPSGVLLISAAYGLSFSSLLLLGGRLADRHGGRRLLRIGLAVLAAASVLAALAPGYATLLAARLAQGVGAALAAPAAVAVVRALLPEPAAYGRAMAGWGGLSVLGATCGNLLSGVVAAWTTWRWLFAVPILVAAAALALSGRLLPAARPAPGDRTDRPRPLDLPGAALAATGICALSLGLVQYGEHPWREPAVLAPLLLGGLLLTGFAAVERRAPDPLLPAGFLADRTRATALLAVMATAAGTALGFLLIALYLQQVRGHGPLATSAAFVPYAAVLLAAGRAAGPLIARYGARPVTAAGLAVAALGSAVLARLDPATPYTTGLLPGLLLLPAGAALSFAGAAVLATAGVPQHRTGLAAGLLNTAMELGPTTVLAALMALAATRPSVVGGYAAAFAAAAAGLALTAVAVAVLARPATRPVRTEVHHHHKEYRS